MHQVMAQVTFYKSTTEYGNINANFQLQKMNHREK